ncbi:MAG: aminopeptidase N C-terminal domain-containing protein, partial [Planctomycetota bacterium]
LAALETEETTALLTAQLEGANNMTDAQAALTLLASSNRDDARAAALQRFYTQWENEPLVIDKWFMAQALSSRPDATASVAALRQHEAFDLRNPNRVRALMAAFGRGNQVRFHDPSGAGYRLVADVVIELNRVNPQVGARLAGSFNAWRRFDTARQTLIRAELERVAATENLKKDIAEIALRALGRS